MRESVDLAAAGLADDREDLRLVRRQVEADVPDGTTRRRESSPPRPEDAADARARSSSSAPSWPVRSVTAWQATRCPARQRSCGGTRGRQTSIASGTARMKTAARRRIGKVGRRALQPLARLGVADPGQAADQVPGVGMARIAEDIARCAPPPPAARHT